MQSVFLFLCLSSIQRFNIISIFSILGSRGIKHLLSDTGLQEVILALIRVSAFLMVRILSYHINDLQSYLFYL